MNVLRVGDRVAFDGWVHQVAALAGTTVRLVDEAGTAQVVLLSHLIWCRPRISSFSTGPQGKRRRV
jgi:hypothetical protein